MDPEYVDPYPEANIARPSVSNCFSTTKHDHHMLSKKLDMVIDCLIFGSVRNARQSGAFLFLFVFVASQPTVSGLELSSTAPPGQVLGHDARPCSSAHEHHADTAACGVRWSLPQGQSG